MLSLLIALLAPAYAVAPVIEAGIGLPELLNVGAGVRVAPRWTVEARYGHVIFNPMVGVGVTGALLGPDGPELPRHALLVEGRVMVNPTLGELRIWGNGGEIIGSGIFLHGGYGFHADSGFMVRPRAGLLIYGDRSLAVAPSLTVSVGWGGK